MMALYKLLNTIIFQVCVTYSALQLDEVTTFAPTWHLHLRLHEDCTRTKGTLD